MKVQVTDIEWHNHFLRKDDYSIIDSMPRKSWLMLMTLVHTKERAVPHSSAS